MTRRPRLRGFTLLEVVLALSLTVMLLGASMTFLWELAERRNSLARGTRDLHAAVVFMERLEADLSAGLAGSDLAGAGVAGTATRLKLLSRAVWLAPDDTASAGGAAMGDLQLSEYAFDPASARLTARRTPVKPGGGDAAGSMELLTDRAERVRFRYYDGKEWRDSFDSMKEGGLPVAIEVAVWFTPLKNTVAPPMADASGETRDAAPGQGDEETPSAAIDMDDTRDERRWPEPDRLRVIIVPDGPVASWKEGE